MNMKLQHKPKKCRLGSLCHTLFSITPLSYNIQDEYIDIQLCDKHLIYLFSISKYLSVTSEIFILTYFNISDSNKTGLISNLRINILDPKAN